MTTDQAAEIRQDIAAIKKQMRHIREHPFAYDPGAGDMLDLRLATLEAELAELLEAELAELADR